MWMWNDTATTEDNFKHSLNIWSNNLASMYLSKWDENLCPHQNSMWKFIAVLPIIAKNCQPRYLSLGEQIKKLCYTYTMECCSATKINEWLSYKNVWKNLTNILLSGRRYPEKAAYCINPTIWHFEKGKTVETIKFSVVTRCSERGREGWNTWNF